MAPTTQSAKLLPTYASLLNKASQNPAINIVEKCINAAFEQFYGQAVPIDASTVRFFARELLPTATDRKEWAKKNPKKKQLRDFIGSMQDVMKQHGKVFVDRQDTARAETYRCTKTNKTRRLNCYKFEVVTTIKTESNVILQNFDFQAAKEKAKEGVIEVPSGVFLLEEREATEMLMSQQIAPMKNANALILAPETSNQPSWEVCNLQPEEYEIVIGRKDTKQMETIKAWILNLNGTNYTVIPEDVHIIIDAAPSIDMCIELKKQYADKAVFKQAVEDPRAAIKSLISKDLAFAHKVVSGPFAIKAYAEYVDGKSKKKQE